VESEVVSRKVDMTSYIFKHVKSRECLSRQTFQAAKAGILDGGWRMERDLDGAHLGHEPLEPQVHLLFSRGSRCLGEPRSSRLIGHSVYWSGLCAAVVCVAFEIASGQRSRAHFQFSRSYKHSPRPSIVHHLPHPHPSQSPLPHLCHSTFVGIQPLPPVPLSLCQTLSPKPLFHSPRIAHLPAMAERILMNEYRTLAKEPWTHIEASYGQQQLHQVSNLTSSLSSSTRTSCGGV
jgi:hypothetical protein